VKVDNRGAIARYKRREDYCQPSVTVSKGFALFSVRPREHEEGRWSKLRAECLAGIATSGVSLEMLQFMPLRMRFIVEKSLVKATQATIQDCGLAWRLIPHCSKVCTVGDAVRATAGIFYKSLTGLAARGIPVLHFSDSGANMSLVVSNTNGINVEIYLRDILMGITGSSISPAISFDATLRKVRVHGEVRRLGSRQAKLLEYLINNAGRVVEAAEAAKHLFGSDRKRDVAAVRVHMHNLRRKIERDLENPRYLVTLQDQGYVFVR
jgi:hypothetical protein